LEVFLSHSRYIFLHVKISDASFNPYISLFICATNLPSAAYSYAVQKELQTIKEHQNETYTKYCKNDYCAALPSFFVLCVFFWVPDYDFLEMCEFLPSETKFSCYFISPHFSSLISEYFVYSYDVGL
jgi:hypothetical protein